jgi:hypothetical protein
MSSEQELTDALAVATEDCAMLRTALADANRELEQAKREQAETERWLRHLERSRSWKLTRPIRDFGARNRWFTQRVKARSTRGA